MTGHQLPTNFVENPEALLRKKRTRATSSSSDLPTVEPVSLAPTSSSLMAKTLRDYSVPAVANVPVGPTVNLADKNFEIRTGLITMVQASPFCGLPSEDANAHLQNFLELCDTIVIKDVAPDAIKLRLFPFSLVGKAKQWFYKDPEVVSTWTKCSTAFLARFFPMGKTNALRARIANFQQSSMEPIPEAWERLQEYILACPHHGMEQWLVLQNFYNGLTPMSKGHIDAAAGGAFLSLTVDQATALIEKMIENQGWGEDRAPTKTQKGMHTVKETDLLAAKIDLLLKRMDDQTANKGAVLPMDSHMTCEVCGNVGHSGGECPETREEAAYINNGFRPNNNGGWNNPRPQGGNTYNPNYNSNAPSLKDLVLGQAKINESISKKLAYNDKMFEGINTKLDNLFSASKNQSSFNEMIKTQISQLTSAVAASNPGRDSVETDPPVETVKMVTTRIGTPRRPDTLVYADSPYIPKKEDPGRPTITCAIGPHVFSNAYCDLGASVNIISKRVNDTVLFAPLTPTKMKLQMADQSVKPAEGIATDILVRISNCYIPTDFVILDMGDDEDAPLILGRPFLNTANATIFVGTGRINFELPGQTLRCHFNGYRIPNPVKPKKTRNKVYRPREQCAMIRLKYGSNKQGLREVEINPEKLYSFSLPMQKPEPRKKAAPKKITEKPKVIPTPPKKVWKKKEIQTADTILPKRTIKVWQKKEPSASVSPGAEKSPTSK